MKGVFQNLLFACFGMVWLMFSPAPAAALEIVPVWDSSITDDPEAATIESTLQSAIQFYEARFSDAITVKITFKEKTNGLGSSQFWYWSIPYSQFRTNLQNDASTANDALALAHLPNGTQNPVNGLSTLRVKTATLRALGIKGMGSGLAGGVDGIVSLHTSIMNLSRDSNNKSKYDMMVSAEHEIDEVLGLGSALDGTGQHSYPQDMFRYDSSGNRNFTTNGDDAYFSIDGTNLLSRFNQQAGLDFGDWWITGSHSNQVQDAEIRSGVTPNLGVELTALDVIGYNLLPLPEPVITGVGISNRNLVLSCANGMATGTYRTFASTNLSLPMSQWTALATNTLGSNGAFTITVTNALNASLKQQFYRLRLDY
jgi:hypothetical protein